MSETKTMMDAGTITRWPWNDIWPEPMKDGEEFWGAEDVELFSHDSHMTEMLEIKKYMDELVDQGRLLPDYTLNPEYDDFGDEDTDESFAPEMGEDYWRDSPDDEGFEFDRWSEDLAEHINYLKLATPSPVSEIQWIIGYEFENENLIRQAFTRRAFGLEFDTGCSEELEFFGDTVLNMCVTREISRQLSENNMFRPEGPFRCQHNEGEMTRIRDHFICKEYLSERAAVLGLDKYILYGTDEEPSESAREDMMEALIGAVAVDSGWDWNVLEEAVDRLISLQLSDPDDLLKATYFDLLNAWHQKHFGRTPEYDLFGTAPDQSGYSRYHCTLYYKVPENNSGVPTEQRIEADGESRSKAREKAASKAYGFLMKNGLWIRLSDAKIEPQLDDAINQLQELYQKKYVDSPIYEFAERYSESEDWYCQCACGGVSGFGRAAGKIRAKKKAAFMTLVLLMKSAGICKDEWEKEMHETLNPDPKTR